MLPTETGKSFWEKPEGKGAKFITALLVVGAGIVLYYALPFIIVMLTNLYIALAMLAGLAMITILFMDERFRNLLWYMYKVSMRGLVSAFVVINPLAIAKTYIQNLKDKKRKMGLQIEKLNGQIKSLERIIANNKNDINKNLSIAQRASKEQENARVKTVMMVKSRKAGRLKNSNIKYETMLEKMKALYKLLSDMEYYSGFMIEDLAHEVEMQEIEYKTIQQAYSVMKSAKDIISGGTVEKELFDEAMQKMVDDIDMKVGKMERFMQMSETFITTVDLENGVYEEEGLAMLEDWINNGPKIIFGDQDKIKNNPIGYSRNIEEPIRIEEPTPFKYF